MNNAQQATRVANVYDEPVPRKPHYISVKAVANYLGMSERTIRRMIKDGRLTGYRIEGSRTIMLELGEVKDKIKPLQ